MREIKFRAWDWEQEKFYYTRLTDILDDAIVQSVCNDNEVSLLWSRTDDIEFQQYTGLKDKNGVEIYEGDILNSKNDGSNGCDVWDYKTYSNRVVKWCSINGCFTNLPDYPENSVYSYKYIEVIGNIYENPELLKGDHNG